MPPGLRVAYFVQLQGGSAPGHGGYRAGVPEAAGQRDLAAQWAGGPAWWGRLAVAGGAERAVGGQGLLAQRLPAAEVAGLAGRFIPGLAAEENVTLGSVGASLRWTPGAEFEVEFWPGKAPSWWPWIRRWRWGNGGFISTVGVCGAAAGRYGGTG